jgi:AcrR family transcriptional regulator
MSTPRIASPHRPRTKAAQTAATTRALLDTARTLFTERGYAATSTEEIVRGAGVTRGALYHHFSGKDDLFRVVFEELETELNDAVVAAAAAQTDPWRQMLTGCRACLEFYLREDFRQIVLVDGPATLGLARWYEIDRALGLATATTGIRVLQEAGELPAGPPEPLAVLIFGALNQAGMTIANADDADAEQARLLVALEQLLDGLRGLHHR